MYLVVRGGTSTGTLLFTRVAAQNGLYAKGTSLSILSRGLRGDRRQENDLSFSSVSVKPNAAFVSSRAILEALEQEAEKLAHKDVPLFQQNSPIKRAPLKLEKERKDRRSTEQAKASQSSRELKAEKVQSDSEDLRQPIDFATRQKRADLPSANSILVSDVQQDSKSIVEVTEANQHEALRRLITPLFDWPYEKQLEAKKTFTHDLAKRFAADMKQSKVFLPDIVPSPKQMEYRCSDELSIGEGFDGNLKTVGFFLRSKRGNETRTYCVPPEQLDCIKREHKLVAKMYEDYIRQSELKAGFNCFWQGIGLRSNAKGEVMANVIYFPNKMSKDSLALEKLKFANYVESKNGTEVNVKSVYFSTNIRGRIESEHALGQRYLEEEVGGFRFRLLPTSKFAVNVGIAESLLKLVGEECRLKSESDVLLDLYCGPGLFTVLLASQGWRCVGVAEDRADAELAEENALANGTGNCEFHHGKVEEILNDVYDRLLLQPGNFTVLMNPSRGGAHPSLIKLLRDNKRVRRIVYLSKKPEGHSYKNFTDLCRWRYADKDKFVSNSKQFSLKAVIPLDVAPMNQSCESAWVFSR